MTTPAALLGLDLLLSEMGNFDAAQSIGVITGGQCYVGKIRETVNGFLVVISESSPQPVLIPLASVSAIVPSDAVREMKAQAMRAGMVPRVVQQ